jgi:hypothetical protein
MQRYSGIFMGWRKKPSSEIEAKMEGSGDDREPQGLAFLADEFDKLQQTINRTESSLVQHLDEYQETSRRGQTEISETLKKVDENCYCSTALACRSNTLGVSGCVLAG